jgi:hypothetical protein
VSHVLGREWQRGNHTCITCMQVTVYDDQHMGDYIAVVVHFTNGKTPHHAGGVGVRLTGM